MHTVKDARIFVDSLNADQRRALANALLVAGRDYNANLVAARLCEAILLARAVQNVSLWR
jgi:hypothetical protein